MFDKNVGDFDGVFIFVVVKIDVIYMILDQSYMVMELYVLMVVWDGNKFIFWILNQMIDWCCIDLVKMLKVFVENVCIIFLYIGGGFGGKLFLRSDVLLVVFVV